MIERAPTQAQLTDDKGRINNGSWQGWFQKFDDYYNRILKWTDPDNADFGTIEPSSKFTGMIVYANGTAWDPGNGAGYYRYTGSAWVPCPPTYDDPPHVPEWTIIDDVTVLSGGTQTSYTAINCSSAIPDGCKAVYGTWYLEKALAVHIDAYLAPRSSGVGKIFLRQVWDISGYYISVNNSVIATPFMMAVENPAATALYYKSGFNTPQVTVRISGYLK